MIKSILFSAVFFASASAAFCFQTIATQQDWDDAFEHRYGVSEPYIDVTNGDEQGVFSWQAHYWVLAYVNMAIAFDDVKYLERAERLIDVMLSQRDDARHARGEIDVISEPYFSAPMYYLKNRGVPAPGWRNLEYNNEVRVQTLNDGQITQAIMRFVDAVFSRPAFGAFFIKAEEYVQKVEETVQAHNTLFVFDRFENIAGSYYYPNPDGSRLYSGGVPYNHNATMGVTLLLLNKVKGGVAEYRDKAEAIVAYFKNFVRLGAGGGYVWDYNLQKPAGGVEDFNHGHIDIGFLLLAHQEKFDVTELDLQRLTNTLTRQLYLGNGEFAWRVDGSDVNEKKNYLPAAIDWIGLASRNERALEIAEATFTKHYPQPYWSRPFLGWANILLWRKTIGEKDVTPPSKPGSLKVEMKVKF